mmetsp:Transcript_122598/g.306181  ORF Transcript_122598/g.306181 Transcript_122598/m.306181 type:complete len:219 (+) Transcript_122598:1774-2430(+)
MAQQVGHQQTFAFHVHEASLPHFYCGRQALERGLAQLDLSRHTLLHHPCRCVHGVAKEPQAWQLFTDNSSNNRASVDAHLEAHAPGLGVLEPLNVVCDLHEALQQVPVGGLGTRAADAALLGHGLHAHGADVLRADGLDLRDAALQANLVQLREVIIQKSQRVLRALLARYVVEVLDQDEQDGCLVYVVSLNLVRVLQHGHHQERRQHAIKHVVQAGA